MPNPLSNRTSVARCQNCGGPLSTFRERQEGFCLNLRCRKPSLEKMAAEAEAAKVRARHERDLFAASLRESLFELAVEAMAAAKNGILIVVPTLQRDIVKQSEDRIKKFRTHITNTVHQAALELEDDSEVTLPANLESQIDRTNTPLAIINACTTCRGVCCLQGAEHAFLRSSEIAARLVKEPEQTVETIVDNYMSRIPEYAYEGSCLFHGDEGCVLPREIRSSTCNTFRCTGIVDAQSEFSQSPGKPTIAAAVEKGKCHRVGVMLFSDQRHEFDAPEDIFE